MPCGRSSQVHYIRKKEILLWKNWYSPRARASSERNINSKFEVSSKSINYFGVWR